MSDHHWVKGQCRICGVKSTEVYCNHVWKGIQCSICGLTQEQALAGFQIPSEVKPLLGVGRRMRGLGSNLAEIERSGDCYYLHVTVSDMTRKGGGPAITAGQILNGHVAAAALAAQMLIQTAGTAKSPNPLVDQHLAQQQKPCSCGNKGFRDLAFSGLDRSGIASIEYKCIFCGTTETFKVDHSR
jgi:hypothetical protein